MAVSMAHASIRRSVSAMMATIGMPPVPNAAHDVTANARMAVARHPTIVPATRASPLTEPVNYVCPIAIRRAFSALARPPTSANATLNIISKTGHWRNASPSARCPVWTPNAPSRMCASATTDSSATTKTNRTSVIVASFVCTSRTSVCVWKNHNGSKVINCTRMKRYRVSAIVAIVWMAIVRMTPNANASWAIWNSTILLVWPMIHAWSKRMMGVAAEWITRSQVEAPLFASASTVFAWAIIHAPALGTIKLVPKTPTNVYQYATGNA